MPILPGIFETPPGLPPGCHYEGTILDQYPVCDCVATGKCASGEPPPPISWEFERDRQTNPFLYTKYVQPHIPTKFYPGMGPRDWQVHWGGWSNPYAHGPDNPLVRADGHIPSPMPWPWNDPGLPRIGKRDLESSFVAAPPNRTGSASTNTDTFADNRLLFGAGNAVRPDLAPIMTLLIFCLIFMMR